MNKYRVRAGQKVDLHDFDPSDTTLISGKVEGIEQSAALRSRLYELQEVLFAEHRRKLLVVLQGMDTSGKDGTVRHVMGGFNPQGTRVVSFGPPSLEELNHDYLWRVHQQVPGKGEVVVFNRSHYEDVLVVRVHGLMPKSVWKKRYEQIRAFEQMLLDEGTVILKFFLHISKDEQRKRLQARIDNPAKRWKFQHGDLEERKLWTDYQRAYEEALSKTSTDESPWYIIPANRKWYRNYLVGSILTDTLEKLDMKYPEVDLTGVEIH
ncbi:MAG TPA: polyphosphate kinase 2 family protein [Gemmatimonadales bacterium]|jgi:PPK2 family polyphosphate:nucleotide phosphotransferase|nr:polyphosphate kinase 2 family protein [Gemmatimonadales bacterium]